MLRPMLLVKVGLAGLAFAARRGESRADHTSSTVTTTTTPTSEPPAVRPGRESPGAFLRRHLEDELAGRFARSWDELHPAHQQVVSRERYARCRAELFASLGAAPSLVGFEVVAAVDEFVRAPGISETTAKAVTVRVRILDGGETYEGTETLHAVDVEGRWAWILAESAYRAYEAGSSPGARAVRRAV